MKKGVKIFGLMLLSLILLSSFVIAADSGVGKMVGTFGDIIKSIYDVGIEPLAKFMIGTESAYDPALFFSLIVILVLLVSVLWEITERIPFIGGNNWVQFIVSFGIGLISVRFLGASANSAWLEVVLLPNQALGIALMCAIPLIIYFFFVMDVGAKSPTLAKILWTFAAVLFATLYLIRADTISSPSGINPATVYLLTAVVAIGLLFFDGTIRKWYKQIFLEKAQYAGHAQTRAHLGDLLVSIKRQYADNIKGYKSIYDDGKPAGFKSYQHDLAEINKALAELK